MFNTTEKGLQLYKNRVEEFLKKRRTMAKGGCSRAGPGYPDVMTRLTEQRNWYDKESALLEGMVIALGLSGDEIEEIWETITKKLGTD